MKDLFFTFFLLSLILTIGYCFVVHFEMRCDDYCIRLLDGTTVVKDMKNSFQYKNEMHPFKFTFSLNNSISIVVKNNEGSLSLCGKVDFEYFFLTTNYYNLWTVGLPGEGCYGKPVISYNYHEYSVLEVSRNEYPLNYQECTFTLSLDICNNNVYYITINETRELDYIDMLNVEQSGKFDRMHAFFDFTSINGGILQSNGNPIIVHQFYTLGRKLEYIGSNDLNKLGNIDLVDIEFFSEDDNTKFASCQLTFILCGANCFKCEPDSLLCLVCENDYSFKDTIERPDCDKTSDLENLPYYYIPEHNLFKKCYDLCLSCDEEGTEYIHNCNECLNNYFSYSVINEKGNSVLNCVQNCSSTIYPYSYNNQCISKCPKEAPYIDNGECVSDCGNKIIDETTYQCVNNCRDSPSHGYLQELNIKKCIVSCPSFALLDIDDNKCVNSCPPQAPFVLNIEPLTLCVADCSNNLIEQTPSGDVCVDQCSTSHYVLQEKICVSSCPAPFIYIDQYRMRCVEDCPFFKQKEPYLCVDKCSEGYFQYKNKCLKKCPTSTMSIDDSYHKQCVNDCSDVAGYYSIEEEKKCVSECSEPYKYLIKDKERCVLFCPNDYPLKKEDKNECFNHCPLGYIENDGICKIDLEIVNNSSITVSFTKEEVLSSIEEIVDLSLSYNITFIGNDYVFHCYSINDTLNTGDSTSIIDLRNCTNLLTSSEEDFIVAQFDIQGNSGANQIEYTVIDSNNEIVNLSICKGQQATVKYILDPITLGIDISKVTEMAEQGIDIFNPDDPFFNDICYPYTTNSNTDIPLKDRRKDIFQNVSLCDTDCTYKGFDPITYEVTCDCSIKIEMTLTPKTPSVPIYNKLLESTNIVIIKCHKLLRNKSNYLYNIGFWLFLVFTIFIIFLMFYYYCISQNMFYQLLFINIRSSPNSQFIQTSSIISSSRPSVENECEPMEKKIKYQEEDIDDIDNAPFNVAFREDHRIYLKMLFDNCLS